MPGASLILRVICLGVLTSEAALNGPVRPEKLSRRALLAGTLAMPLLVAVPQKGSTSEDGPQDPRTTWSFFGLVAPPIQATWSYDTLVEQAKAENIATIQTATSHDCVVATGHDGMRFVSMVADDAIPALLIATQKSDGSLPFEVLPIDPNRAAVRDVATQFLNLLGVLWLADQADLLPWDTTPYGSIAEREAAQRGGEKVKMKLLTRLRSTFEKKKKKAPTVLKRRVAAGVDHDEAMRRVLGLVSWDAAAELKEKIKLAGLEAAHQLKKGGHAGPVELLEHEIAKVPGAFAKVGPAFAKVPGALKRIPWATPACVSFERLPTFEQLCTRAWCITTDSGVAQYIRVHPTDATSPVGLGLAATVDSAARFDAELGLCRLVFDAETAQTVCRLDDKFSAIYGHRIYLCKRLVPA